MFSRNDIKLTRHVFNLISLKHIIYTQNKIPRTHKPTGIGSCASKTYLLKRILA